MIRNRARLLAAGVTTVAVLVGGCAGGDELPDVVTSQQGQGGQGEKTVEGMLTSATEQAVMLRLPDGSTRVFALKPEDVDRVGLSHLASHAGDPTIRFRISYTTAQGKDYLAKAEEIPPAG